MTDNDKKNPEGAKEIQDDLSKYKAISATLDTEGGQLLLETLRLNIANDVEIVISSLNSPLPEIQVAIAKLKVNLDFYRVLKRSKDNVKLAQEALDKLLEDAHI